VIAGRSVQADPPSGAKGVPEILPMAHVEGRRRFLTSKAAFLTDQPPVHTSMITPQVYTLDVFFIVDKADRAIAARQMGGVEVAPAAATQARGVAGWPTAP
jgi:hypothetical protein